MSVIWGEKYLQDKLWGAEQDAVGKVDYIFHRFTLATTVGLSVYALPNYVRKVQRVTWKGNKVWPVSWHDMRDLAPANAYIGNSNYQASQGKPLYWCLHPTNYREIQFYPTPNEALSVHDSSTIDLNLSTNLDDYLVISCWRSPASNNADFQLPRYMARRTKKAYALREAFLKEGKGQNLKASDYFDEKYSWEIENFKKINRGCFVSRRPGLSPDGSIPSIYGRKPARPVLPPDYPRRSY